MIQIFKVFVELFLVVDATRGSLPVKLEPTCLVNFVNSNKGPLQRIPVERHSTSTYTYFDTQHLFLNHKTISKTEINLNQGYLRSHTFSWKLQQL